MKSGQIILFGFAFFILPAAYLHLCKRMKRAAVPHPPVMSFFVILGTTGGWLLTLALPSYGLQAMCTVFLVTVAPAAVLVSSLYLAIRPERSIYHRIALWGGVCYTGFFILWMSLLLGA